MVLQQEPAHGHGHGGGEASGEHVGGQLGGHGQQLPSRTGAQVNAFAVSIYNIKNYIL